MFVLIYFKYKKKNIRELNYNIRFKSFRALIFEKKKKQWKINYRIYTKISVETQLLSYKQFKFALRWSKAETKRNDAAMWWNYLILSRFIQHK